MPIRNMCTNSLKKKYKRGTRKFYKRIENELMKSVPLSDIDVVTRKNVKVIIRLSKERNKMFCRQRKNNYV